MTSRSIILGVFAIILSACASQAPLDDAYYWPDKKAPTKPEQTMEIVSQSDTTITVRIKR